MATVLGINFHNATTSALGGIRRGLDRFERAATDVAHRGAAASNASVVQLSDEARARAGNAIVEGVEQALIDSRMAKHEVAANVRVLNTQSEMSRELLDVIG